MLHGVDVLSSSLRQRPPPPGPAPGITVFQNQVPNSKGRAVIHSDELPPESHTNYRPSHRPITARVTDQLPPARRGPCVRLVLFHWPLRVRSATGRAAARRRAVADLTGSNRTRRAATVRCRQMHPGAVLTRRRPSAMPTGARILVGQVRDYSRRPRLTRAWAPARGR